MSQQPIIIIQDDGGKKDNGGWMILLVAALIIAFIWKPWLPKTQSTPASEGVIAARPAEFDALMNQTSAPNNPPMASIIPPSQLPGDCTNSAVNTPGQLLPRDQIVVQNADGTYTRVIDFCTVGMCGYNSVTDWGHVYEHYDEIAARAAEGCYNPAFILTWYIEETGAGNCARFGQDTKDLGIVFKTDGTPAKTCDWQEQFDQFLQKYKQYAFTDRADIAGCRGADGLSLREWLLIFGPGPKFCDKTDPDDGGNGSFDGMNFQNRGAQLYLALTGGTGQLDFQTK